jgi:ATP-dependent DNA ligase
MVRMGPLKSTRQQLVKVAQVPGLYRHSLNFGYYGIKKVGGKRKEHSLHTKDRKLAERRLKEWLLNLGKVDTGVERLTLEELVEKLQKARAGKSPQTQATDRAIIKKLRETWPYDYRTKVTDIRPSHLNEWLALHDRTISRRARWRRKPSNCSATRHAARP